MNVTVERNRRGPLMTCLNNLVVPVALGLTALVMLSGCGEKAEPLTRTEELRMTLNPAVAEFMVKAEEAYERGVYRVALAYSDSADALAPELADVHFLRGRVYAELGQYDISRAAYERVLELDPEYRGARMNIGVNEFRQGRLREALLYMKAEEELGPHSALFLEMGRVYAQLGVADSAQMAFERSIELDSTNATAYMWYGQLLEELGDLEKALVYSRKGLTYQPENMDYRYIVGSQLYRSGKVEESATYLRTVADQRPFHHGAQYNLGQALMRLGKEEEAGYYLARADSAQQLQQKINEAQDAVTREPDVLQNWLDLGGLNRQAGLQEQAIDAFKVAAAMEPANLYIQVNLATMIMERGDTEDAIARYKAVLKVDSTLSDVWFNLGVAYANIGQYQNAHQAWATVLDHKPGYQQARTYMAQIADKL